MLQKDTVPGWEIGKCIPKKRFMGKVALMMGFERFIPRQFGNENIVIG